MIEGQLLFAPHIQHAFNALQHLRAMYILGDCTDDVIYSTCSDIAREIGAPEDSLWRAMGKLVRAKLVESKQGEGYYVTPEALCNTKVIDVLRALGKEVPDNGYTRASDRLNNVVADCFDVKLEEFFK